MKTLNKKIENIYHLSENNVYTFEDDGSTVFLNKTKDFLKVAIPYDGKENIFEEFVGMEIYTTDVYYDEKTVSSLTLRAKSGVDKNKFLLIASSFVAEKGTIINNPYDWIEKWKNLFGDSLSKKMVHDILAEMLVYLFFYKKDRSYKWAGRKGCTHDIVGVANNIEVKATTDKTANEIHVNSSYQLSEDKQTLLCFVRLEKKEHGGISINSIKNDLIKEGCEEDEIESNLEKEGFKRGKRIRNQEYDLLEMNLYNVTKDSFPIISIDDINSFAKYKNILGYQLLLDLTPIQKETLFEKK